MFDPTDGARVFAIPLGADFSARFAEGLVSRAMALPPEVLGRTVIFVNSGRMARAVNARLRDHGARLLPKVHIVTDLPNLPGQPIRLPEPVPPLRRQLLLAQAVGALLRAAPDLAPQTAKFALAQSLAQLMDEMQAEGLPRDALDTIDVETHSAHWARSLRFLRIIRDHWGAHRGSDPQDRLRQAADHLAAHWRVSPPETPVIVAGSTGSRGATALLMESVARLPQGAVVLPGWDDTQPPAVWAAVAKGPADHPQALLATLCGRLDRDPSTLPQWHDGSAASPRNRLISLAMRPAPITDQWLDQGPGLIPDLPAATDTLTMQEAATPREEALAIALRLRAAVEDRQTAVLITPDRMLARRVGATLGRWGITPDDSAGRPLHLTPPGVLARLVAACIGRHIAPEVLVALLKHPLTGSGQTTGDHRLLSRRFEIEVLRKKGGPWVDFEALRAWAYCEKADDPKRRAWGDWVIGALHGVAPLKTADAAGFLAAHRGAIDALASGPDGGEGSAWAQEDGTAVATLFDELLAEAYFAETPDATEYRTLFDALLTARNVTAARPSHPDIRIWGSQEARVAQADVVILGGLNDDIWPGVDRPDPWLSRSMRAQAGLPLPDKLTGLSAHDFQQAACAGEVVLSRALRDGEAPTVGSRWIVRLFNLLGGLGDAGQSTLGTMRARGDHWLALARAMDRPGKPVKPAVRPAPCPPVAARFRELSVTEVEKLIRDPYSVYARRTLDLRKLDPLGQEADALMRGNVLHEVMERFNTEYPETLPDDATGALMDTVRRVMDETVPWPAVRTLWLARIARVAGALAAGETERRARGSVAGIEVWGERRLESPDVRLYGKADRIDRMHDGRLAIYDYKAGAPPTPAQQKTFNKQLPLEAAIAGENGFENIAAAEVGWLEYVSLSGVGLDTENRGAGTGFSAAEAAEVWAEFGQLVAAYHAPDQGFASRTRVRTLSYDYDFDHLARLGEWWETDDPVRVPVG